MRTEQALSKLDLPEGITLIPGETVEYMRKTSAIKLFEATMDGGFIEYGADHDYYNSFDIANESTVIITNYRTCYQPHRNTLPSSLTSPILAYAPPVQIPHLSIFEIDCLPMQITLSLNFSPAKYLFKFSNTKSTAASGSVNSNARKTASSLWDEFVEFLKRFAVPTCVENVFAFRMGEEAIRQDCNKITEIKGIQKVKPQNYRKLSKEQIFDDLFGGSDTDDEDEDEVETKGIDENVYMRAQILGWFKGYLIQKEFERMQMSPDSWCIASVNDDFSLSPTYPQEFILPSKILKNNASGDAGLLSDSFYPGSVSDCTISQSTPQFFSNLARFRSRGRFPVISWKIGNHVLMRSGQPMTGFLGSRGLEDECLMWEVLRAVHDEQSNYSPPKASSSRHWKTAQTMPENCKLPMKICLLDARNRTSAFSNGYSGGGYEKTENYPPNTTLSFLNLPNIHAISKSHRSLLNAISTNAQCSNWYSVLESTGWLGHVADLLKAAGGRDGVVGKIVDEDASVLVHCTDGWDRTTQLVSLAQIMLDPFYRTIKGLQVLIEKEWVAFGHPFRSRGKLPNALNNSSRSKQTSSQSTHQDVQATPSPVFLLFLTCVHHILQQFPAAFEYNDFLLLCLARAVAGNSPFGDFLCNSELERESLRLRERTKSIWSWVRERRQWFRNVRYPRKRDRNHILTDNSWKKDVIRPETGARLITLWNEYYFPKDDLSIALLSTPSGTNIVTSNSLGIHHSCQVGGFPVFLFVKERRRRVYEEAWGKWRAALKRKSQQKPTSEEKVGNFNKQKRLEQNEIKEDKWDAVEEMVVGEEESCHSDSSDTQHHYLHKLPELNGSKVLLTVKHQQRKSSANSSSNNLSPSPDPIILNHGPSIPVEKAETDRQEDTDESNEEDLVRELYDSNRLEWVYLSRQSDVSSSLATDIVDVSDLKEAQSDNNPLFDRKHDNNKTIEDLLREAQLEDSHISGRNIHHISSVTTTNIQNATTANTGSIYCSTPVDLDELRTTLSDIDHKPASNSRGGVNDVSSQSSSTTDLREYVIV